MIEARPLSMPEPSRWFGWWHRKFEDAVRADYGRDGLKGVVYFLAAPSVNRVKIGTSARLEARIAEIGTWSPVDLEVMGTVPGGLYLERAFHEAFATFRARGEWFDVNERSKPLMGEILKAGGLFSLLAAETMLADERVASGFPDFVASLPDDQARSVVAMLRRMGNALIEIANAKDGSGE